MSSKYSIVAEARINPQHVEDVYLATPFQQGVLHASTKSQPPGRFFIAAYNIHLPPLTNVDRLHACWDTMVNAVSILRTGFILSSQGVLAVVYKADAPHRYMWTQYIRDDLEETGMQTAGLRFIEHLTFESFSGCIPLSIHTVGSPNSGYQIRFCFHHSIFDGSSMVALMRSLHALYHQGSSCPTVRLPKASFASVAAAINSQDLAAKKASNEYWRQLVNDFPDASWPISSTGQSQITIVRSCSVPGNYNPNFPAFRSRIVRAALALTMAMHSGLGDHLFCETRSSRAFLPSDLQSIPGPCLSAQLVRLRCDSSSSLTQLLNDAGSKMTEKVVKECPMSLGQIFEAIGARAATKVRIFLTVYAAPFWLKNEDIPGWQFLDHWTQHDTPLNIDVFHPRDGACQIRLRYDSSISRSVDVDTFLDHFISTLGILSSMESTVSVSASQQYTVQDVFCRLGQIDTPRTLRFGLGPLNSVERNTMNSSSYPLIHEIFQDVARLNSDVPALDFEGTSTMTYKELDLRSTMLAIELKDKMGVQPDDMICLLFDNSFEMIIAILAVLKAGGAYVPLGVDLPIERIERILDIAGGKILLYGEGTPASRAAELKKSFLTLKSMLLLLEGPGRTDISLHSSSEPLPKVAGENLAYVFFTSGSTGTPKGVGVEHRNLSAFAHSGQADFATHPGMRKLLLSPYTFDISVGDIFSTLTGGHTLVLVRRDELLSNLPFWLAETRTTHLSVTPSVARQIPSNGLPNLTYINFVGETVPVDLAARLSQNKEVRNTFGPTESVVSVTEWIIPSQSTVGSIGERVTIGLPIGHNNIYILRPSTNDLSAIGEMGEICIGGSQVSRGYVSDATLSATKFIPDPFSKVPGAQMFRSGDLGKWNRDGMIEHMGRMDGQVKFRGQRIETGEIETVVLQSNQDILAVYADIHRIDGEQVMVGVFTLHSGASAMMERQVIAGYSDTWAIPLSEGRVNTVVQSAEEACQRLLPKYMRPTVWLCLNAFPKDPHGKLNRRNLKKLVQEYVSICLGIEMSIRRAITEAEHIIVSILSQVLGRNSDMINLDASFLSLGGTSLQAMRVTTALQARGIGATVSDCLDDRKTVGMLACLPRIQVRNLKPSSIIPNGLNPNHQRESYVPFSLSAAGWEAGVKAVGLQIENVEDVYPCNATAREWVELALQNQGRSFLCQFQYDLGADLDSSRFVLAWEQLCLIEPALRTVFIEVPASGFITSVVLRPDLTLLKGRGAALEVLKLQNGKEVEEKIEEVLGEHRLILGIAPNKNWLFHNEESGKWTLATSRHHSLHDAKTLDFQAIDLSILYHRGIQAVESLSTKRGLRTSFGVYMQSISHSKNKAFWENYLGTAVPPTWPSSKDVMVGYSKDLGLFQFGIGQWTGNLADLARKIGVAKGAVVRAAYAMAVAEQQRRYAVNGTKRNNDVLVYEMVEGRGAAGLEDVWGFCMHMDVIKVPVHGFDFSTTERSDKNRYLNKLLEVVKEANRNFADTLPAMAEGIEIAAEVLGPKVEKGFKFQTSFVNILDMSQGDLRIDKNPAAPQVVKGDKSLFVGTLIRSTIVGIYLPFHVEIHITKENVKFICPYDPDVVKKEDMDVVVQRMVEVLDTLSAEI
ncbi:hypothetical protein GYMLUDRAFT_181590 [Collybiopsis luxurians FD-317 M1]|uniref:Carrier domain-containing protein n=1 Tax=Collybiopsis luxurians FD-317 M1 TaxID=944289 RepID=A0A0D0BAI6_9AGAR|nr:hypothetical protein GYMLUDRAFT_181590 [Collybiopsis luxurians FD-317 M1]